MSTNNACVHTAGPWTVDDGEIIANGFVLGLVYGTDDYPCSEDETREECQANASLIAAAPELLEACRMSIEDCQCSQQCDGPHQDCPCWYCRTCAAIAKATGQP